ncbi:MAG: flagellar motor switch protein FliN [Candidatus Dadabacteria bacterium]|nr:MAG: flagellar motor switch protein FliN [Candidatus Dadabacteria bacterium]
MAENENEEKKEEEAQEQGGAEGEAASSDAGENLEQVAEAAEGVAKAAQSAAEKAGERQRTIEFLMDIPLAVTVEVGRSRMTIQDLLQMGQGSVVELEKVAGEPLDIYINGRKVAVGEAVVINEKFGVRIIDIISPKERLEGLK